MPTTSNTIANRAINLIGNNQTAITGEYPNFDGSAAGLASNTLYAGVVQTVGRTFGFDFSRNIATLALSGNPTTPVGWVYEYLYPTNGIQVRQIMPSVQTDLNDPLPSNWSEGNILVSGLVKKVIWTNIQNALAVITNQPQEDLWDSLFAEEVVRLLASELAMAVSGKPDVAKDNLESSAAFGKVAVTRDS